MPASQVLQSSPPTSWGHFIRHLQSQLFSASRHSFSRVMVSKRVRVWWEDSQEDDFRRLIETWLQSTDTHSQNTIPSECDFRPFDRLRQKSRPLEGFYSANTYHLIFYRTVRDSQAQSLPKVSGLCVAAPLSRLFYGGLCSCAPLTLAAKFSYGSQVPSVKWAIIFTHDRRKKLNKFSVPAMCNT